VDLIARLPALAVRFGSAHLVVLATSVRRWTCRSNSDGSTGLGSQAMVVATSDGMALEVSVAHGSHVKRFTELVATKPATLSSFPGVPVLWPCSCHWAPCSAETTSVSHGRCWKHHSADARTRQPPAIAALLEMTDEEMRKGWKSHQYSIFRERRRDSRVNLLRVPSHFCHPSGRLQSCVLTSPTSTPHDGSTMFLSLV
jgi:hypothetical protein